VFHQPLGLFDDHLGTCTWRAAGSSNVELITSPFTERCMSVTSSGRSSISRTINTTQDDWWKRNGDRLQQHRLAGARRSDDQATLAFATGVSRSITRPLMPSRTVSILMRSCG